MWVSGAPTDKLTWDAVSGAVTYKVYSYGNYTAPLAANVTATTFQVPTNQWIADLTYTVTAVDASGLESIVSNQVTAQGFPNPSVPANPYSNFPQVPTQVQAVGERNAGVPRIGVTWRGHIDRVTYTVYRRVNGQGSFTKIAEGLWGLHYLDRNVVANATYEYKISASNVQWNGAANVVVESEQSSGALAVAPASDPPINPAAALTIHSVRSNDDSVRVGFTAVAGAKDYRVYVFNGGNSVNYKYSGGKTSVELNGLTPGVANYVRVEALDKLGPFQKMDGGFEPGMMQSDNTMVMHINGQGDPSNKPLVLATSPSVDVRCRAFSLTGAQPFWDRFETGSFDPLVSQTPPAAVVAAQLNRGGVTQFGNNKWTIRNYGGDMATSSYFAMSGHFMDTLFDGGTAGLTPPLHMINAAMVMSPKSATADMSAGKVLHVTFEVDGHFDSRRWCDVHVVPVGDELLLPNDQFFAPKFTSGDRSFMWSIFGDSHKYTTVAPGPLRTNFTAPQLRRYSGWPGFNGTMADLDSRVRYDLYLSNQRVMILESNPNMNGGQPVVMEDRALTNLGLGNVRVFFSHQFYHSLNERASLIQYDPEETYWINHRPWADERHWDNMGHEVVNGFPIAVGNPSFETPDVWSPNRWAAFRYAGDPLLSGHSWSFSGNSGIAHNTSGFLKPNTFDTVNTPEGSQTGFLQSQPNQAAPEITQTLSGFHGGVTYQIRVAAVQRKLNGVWNNQTVQVLMDGVNVGTATPPTHTASELVFTYTCPSSGSHTLKLKGGASTSDQTAFVDDVRIVVAP